MEMPRSGVLYNAQVRINLCREYEIHSGSEQAAELELTDMLRNDPEFINYILRNMEVSFDVIEDYDAIEAERQRLEEEAYAAHQAARRREMETFLMTDDANDMLYDDNYL